MSSPTTETHPSVGKGPAESVPNQAAFIEKAELQLKEWAAKLEQRVNEVGKLKADAKRIAQKQVDELKTKLATAREKLDAGKGVASDRWIEAKVGLESLWMDVKALFEKDASKPAS
jgi:hypothetical protein